MLRSRELKQLLRSRRLSLCHWQLLAVNLLLFSLHHQLDYFQD
ncbi:MAG: hypothetical protein V7K71_25930 [Nostoc sp.]